MLAVCFQYLLWNIKKIQVPGFNSGLWIWVQDIPLGVQVMNSARLLKSSEDARLSVLEVRSHSCLLHLDIPRLTLNK